MSQFQNQGETLFYSDQGSADNVLLFVHGFCCDHSDWQLQCDALSDNYRTIALDLRGHGQSTNNTGNNGVFDLAQDVAALVDHLAVQDCWLIGHSMGCRVVLEASSLCRDVARGLILVDGSRTVQSVEEADQLAEIVHNVDYKAFIHEQFGQMFSPQSDAQIRERILKRAASLAAEQQLALYGSMIHWDASHMDTRLATVRAPIHVIQSTIIDAHRRRSPLKPKQTSAWLDYLSGCIPPEEQSLIPNVGHFTQLEAAESVNDIIRQFVKRCRAL